MPEHKDSFGYLLRWMYGDDVVPKATYTHVLSEDAPHTRIVEDEDGVIAEMQPKGTVEEGKAMFRILRRQP